MKDLLLYVFMTFGTGVNLYLSTIPPTGKLLILEAEQPVAISGD